MNVFKKKIITYEILVIQLTPKDLFSYISEEVFTIGEVVQVPFGKKKLYGIVYNINNSPYTGEKKFIIKSLNVNLSAETIKFIDTFSDYYLCGKNYVLKNILSQLSLNYKPYVKEHSIIKNPQLILTKPQQDIYENLKLDYGKHQVSLIFGITGSGKTQIYFKLIEDIINSGGQVLLLMPEIAIIGGIKERVKKFLNINFELWFSGKKNVGTWKKVVNGDPILILGARSAIFLPFKNLKLIIIDEEHDTSYKQSNHVAYHCVHMAILLGEIWKANVILGSATPSTETYYEVLNGKYKLYKLLERFGAGVLPKVEFIRETKNVINDYCLKAIKETLEKKQQVLIYLNKRGFGRLLVCIHCNKKQKCKECDQILILHNIKGGMFCHLCNSKYTINVCVYCGLHGLIVHGFGVERLEGYIKNKFPNYEVGIFSSDFCNTLIKIQEFVDKVQDNTYNIIIGTQITSKGHNFPNLALVLIINTQLQMGDFRGKEVLLQNLLQVSGRAGRYADTGKVIIQSSDESIKKWLKEDNYENFLEENIKERQLWALPPFYKFILLKEEHSNLITLKTLMNNIYLELKILQTNTDIKVFPPSANPIERIANKYRMFILIKSREIKNNFLLEIVKKYKINIDISPYDFY
jgi:primosomal protein N' (replication factor Y)